ncbi:uncharacterized protein ACBT44_018645 isoform 1-T1 [Syngnathus typhle]
MRDVGGDADVLTDTGGGQVGGSRRAAMGWHERAERGHPTHMLNLAPLRQAGEQAGPGPPTHDSLFKPPPIYPLFIDLVTQPAPFHTSNLDFAPVRRRRREFD